MNTTKIIRKISKFLQIKVILTMFLFLVFAFVLLYFSPRSLTTYLDPVYGKTYITKSWFNLYNKDYVANNNTETKNFAEWVNSASISDVYPYYQKTSIMVRPHWLNRRWEFYKSEFTNIPELIYKSSMSDQQKVSILQDYQREIWQSFTEGFFRDIVESYQQKIYDLAPESN
jgi:hypothetical protein